MSYGSGLKIEWDNAYPAAHGWVVVGLEIVKVGSSGRCSMWLHTGIVEWDGDAPSGITPTHELLVASHWGTKFVTTPGYHVARNKEDLLYGANGGLYGEDDCNRHTRVLVPEAAIRAGDARVDAIVLLKPGEVETEADIAAADQYNLAWRGRVQSRKALEVAEACKVGG